ncbi:29599_t:CDS:1, partial [Racocetra persica]
ITKVEPESDDEDTILDYLAPNIDSSNEKNFEDIRNLNQDFGCILIWILRYQQRYWFADITTESLIKFIHFLLTYLDQNQVQNFLESLYLA